MLPNDDVNGKLFFPQPDGNDCFSSNRTGSMWCSFSMAPSSSGATAISALICLLGGIYVFACGHHHREEMDFRRLRVVWVSWGRGEIVDFVT